MYRAKRAGTDRIEIFSAQMRGEKDERVFQAPNLSLPEGFADGRLTTRTSLLATLAQQRRDLDS